MTGEQPQTGARCVDVVELLTAYLEGALPEDTKRHVDEHLRECEGCRAALSQWRKTAALTAQLTAAEVASLDPYVLARFTTALHTIRRK
jgi:anti-sigma factor RsiW